MEDIVAGIDVGKWRLDVSVSQGPVRSFDNTPEGIAALASWVASRGASEAVCEPTGGYEREVVRRLRESGLPVHVAHPNKVRNFARAAGYEAKTDVLDARVLSRYGEVFQLASRLPDDGDGQELKELLKRRKELVDQRVQERNRLEKGLRGGARRSTERHIEWLGEEIALMDEEYRKALRESARLSETATLYQSVPGVGELTAASLVAYLPELGKCEGKALTALVGLAPWSRDSGGQRGYRSIRGGRGAVRRVLYLSALSAIRHNEEMGRYYRGLRERGEGWEGGAGSGDAQVVVVAERHCPTGNGVQQQSPRRSIGLTHNTDTPAKAGIQASVRVRTTGNATKCNQMQPK